MDEKGSELWEVGRKEVNILRRREGWSEEVPRFVVEPHLVHRKFARRWSTSPFLVILGLGQDLVT